MQHLYTTPDGMEKAREVLELYAAYRKKRLRKSGKRTDRVEESEFMSITIGPREDDAQEEDKNSSMFLSDEDDTDYDSDCSIMGIHKY